jgi:topoisomerase-4 subunit A
MADNKNNKEPASILDDDDLFSYSAQKAKENEDVGKSLEESSKEQGDDNEALEPVVIPPQTNGLTGVGPLRDLMDDNFLQFAGYVICSRAIPAVEDGLKPVQRRILHALFEKDDGRFIKVANIVGHTMQYHPHGDASIADALVVLANKLWGEGKGYVIEGQGNFGNLYTGMPAAASRYIECRLSDLARNEIFNKKTTRYVPSYDGRNEEPVLLPAKIPLLLMFGVDGIAVGLSTVILPHNFVELLEAEIAIIRKEPIKLYPDFQLGGIMDVSEYNDGQGKVKVRAVIEERDKNKLVITQLPWGETTDSLISNIEEAIKKKKVMVRQIHDLTAQNVEIELVLTTGASQDKVKTALYAFTNCEKSLSSRPVVLDEGRPREMTITKILTRNVERLMALTRQEFDIRLNELDDLFHARTLDRIFVEERIYKRIENEKTYEGVMNTVIEGFKPFLKELRREIVPDDVERLLKIPIRRISLFDINKNRDEIKSILEEEEEVKKNIAGIRGYVIKYLKGLIKTYGKKYPRCTKIAQGPFKQVDVRAITASELSVKYDKETMFVGTGLRGGDELFKCSSLDKVLFLWKDGKYKMMPPPEKQFVDKNFLNVFVYNPEKDREKEFTCVYEEPLYGFAYVKRFTFGGMIQNKEYRLAPEKSKILYFQEGSPENLYVKFKPAKNQRIHQQLFEMKQVTLRGASSKGLQMTTKAIARISPTKGSWWDESEAVSKGVLL